MPMMQIRIVQVCMTQRPMPMPVRMWFCHRAAMSMLMMVVMCVAMLVFQPFMYVFVLVAFGEVHPQTKPHENSRDRKPRCQRFA